MWRHKSDSLVYLSGQWNKFVISLVFIFLFPPLLLIGIALARHEPSYFWVIILGLVSGASGLLFACISIRCPNCEVKWVWLALSKNAPKGEAWLITCCYCPSCNLDMRKFKKSVP